MESTAMKIEEILSLLSAGNNKEQVAKEVGFDNVRKLYQYATRHNLKWNEKVNNYEVPKEKYHKDIKPVVVEDNHTVKIQNIISMIDRGINGHEIAKKFKFEDYNQMAQYMKTRGYEWDINKNNYIKKPNVFLTEDKEEQKINNDENSEETEYKDVIKILISNKDKINQILNSKKDSGKMPRYLISGIKVTKTIGMNHALGNLIKEYCDEMNISQREFFEVASIECLKKYGYANEVKALLKV